MNACVERLRRLYNLALRQGFVTLSFTPECTQPVVGNANQMFSIFTDRKSWMYLPYHPDLLHLAGEKININCVLTPDERIDFGFVIVGERWYPAVPGFIDDADLWLARGLHKYAEQNNRPAEIPYHIAAKFTRDLRYLGNDLAVQIDGEKWSCGCFKKIMWRIGEAVDVAYMIAEERIALAFLVIDGQYYPLIKVGEAVLPARQAQ